MVKQIRIDGAIGQGENEISADMIRSQLPEDGTEPIRVSIHSEGGSVFEGFAIYDLFTNYSGPKTIAVESTAFSIASFITMAFDEVEMSPNAYLMLHNPRVDMEGDDDELSATAGLIGKLKANMIEAYASKSGKTPEEITAILKAETYMNAVDAVANGFANRITEKRVQARAFAQLDKMPHGVVAALFGAGSGGEESEKTTEKSMSDAKPVAATVQEIKAAFPKAKAEFVLSCIEKSLPMASVASAAAEEMMKENEELVAKVSAMEDELGKAKAMIDEAAKAKAMEGEEETVEEESAKATAKRTGVAPVARGTASKPSARVQWSESIDKKVTAGMSRPDAIMAVDRDNPGLRAAMIAEANGQ